MQSCAERQGNPDTNERPWLCRGVALGLILLASSGRIAYLALACPLDLAPDEAHYWDWSRQLDWCYYSKGPVVAVLIRLSCLIFGESALAVRLPAVFCGSLLLASLYILTVQVCRREWLALAVVAAGLTFPLLNAGAMLMTIDAPFACCWSWALVVGHAAIVAGRRWAWPVLGLVIGIGILAKLTMILWFPCLILLLLTCRDKRWLLVRPGFWSMTAIAGLCCLPLVLWNMNHGWVSYQHLLGHAGMEREVRLHWLGPVAFIGGQFGLLLGSWFALWVWALVRQIPWRVRRPEMAYLWWLSVPVFGVFFLFSFVNGGGEINWPAVAYLSGLVLAAGTLAEQARLSHRRRLVPAVVGTSVLGLAITVLMQCSDWPRPILLRLAGPASAERPTPLRRWDPTCRLRGWRQLAASVDTLAEQLRARGIEPVLAAGRWNLPGELAFYCRGRPTAYCLGSVMGDRRSQYDLWRPNPLADVAAFSGKTFILVDCPPQVSRELFVAVEPLPDIVHREDGVPLARWTISIGHSYRGAANPPLRQHRGGHSMLNAL